MTSVLPEGLFFLKMALPKSEKTEFSLRWRLALVVKRKYFIQLYIRHCFLLNFAFHFAVFRLLKARAGNSVAVTKRGWGVFYPALHLTKDPSEDQIRGKQNPLYAGILVRVLSVASI